jgi:hypothetical protein
LAMVPPTQNVSSSGCAKTQAIRCVNYRRLPPLNNLRMNMNMLSRSR